jgi:DNA modification methylase
MVTLHQGDNLQTLRKMVSAERRFDLVELDGPYMANLEEWDNLTEEQYIDHYAERLSLVRELLQPWGVVFVFGYPEGCAEIKSWAHRTKTLYLRRWLTWYKQMTAHKGRKVENILIFTDTIGQKEKLLEFGRSIKAMREKQGWSLEDVGRIAKRPWWHRGGNMYFETGSAGFLSQDDLIDLARIFGFDPSPWWCVVERTFENVTNIDYISKTYIENTTELNDNGLRSKPVGLYLDLFKPTIPPTENKAALILYGGSGNAGIAAAALGYDVTICESDPDRCEIIKRRFDAEVARWKGKLSQRTMFDALPEQKPLFGGGA